MTALYRKIERAAVAAAEQALRAPSRYRTEIHATAWNMRKGAAQESSWSVTVKVGTVKGHAPNTRDCTWRSQFVYVFRVYCTHTEFWTRKQGPGVLPSLPVVWTVSLRDRLSGREVPLDRVKRNASCLAEVMEEIAHAETGWVDTSVCNALPNIPWALRDVVDLESMFGIVTHYDHDGHFQWPADFPPPSDGEDDDEENVSTAPPTTDAPKQEVLKIEDIKPAAARLMDVVKSAPEPAKPAPPVQMTLAEEIQALNAASDRLPVLAILDVETSGLDPAVSEITEVSVALYSLSAAHGRESGLLRTLSTLWHPGLNSPRLVLSDVDDTEVITGISSQGYLTGADAVRRFDMRSGDGCAMLVSWLKSQDVVAIAAHNAAFDRAFIDRLLPADLREGGENPKRWLDTSFTSPWKWASFRRANTNLRDLVLAHGLGISSAHRAGADVDMLVRCLDLYKRDLRTDLVTDLWEASKSLWWDADNPPLLITAEVAYANREIPKSLGLTWSQSTKTWSRMGTVADFRVAKERIKSPDRVWSEPQNDVQAFIDARIERMINRG